MHNQNLEHMIKAHFGANFGWNPIKIFLCEKNHACIGKLLKNL